MYTSFLYEMLDSGALQDKENYFVVIGISEKCLEYDNLKYLDTWGFLFLNLKKKRSVIFDFLPA